MIYTCLHISSYTLSARPNVTISSLLSCWLILLSTSRQDITINLSWDSIPLATHVRTTFVILSPASFKITSFAMFPSMSKPSWCKLLHLALTHSSTNRKKHRFLPNIVAFSGVKLRFRRIEAICSTRCPYGSCVPNVRPTQNRSLSSSSNLIEFWFWSFRFSSECKTSKSSRGQSGSICNAHNKRCLEPWEQGKNCQVS